MVKLIIAENKNGEVYFTNTKNKKGFKVSMPISNATMIVFEKFPKWTFDNILIIDSDSFHYNKKVLNECSFNKEWKKAFNSIGFR